MKIPQFATVQQKQLYEKYVKAKQEKKSAKQQTPQGISKSIAIDPKTGRLKKGYKYGKGGIIIAVKSK